MWLGRSILSLREHALQDLEYLEFHPLGAIFSVSWPIREEAERAPGAAALLERSLAFGVMDAKKYHRGYEDSDEPFAVSMA